MAEQINNQLRLITRIKILINEVIHDRKFLKVRLLVLFSCLISFITLHYSKTIYSFPLFIVQFGVMPFICTDLIIRWINISNSSEGFKAGAIVGAIVGGLPSSILVLIDLTNYFYFGGKETTAAIIYINGFSLSKLELLLFGFINGFANFVILVIFSASIGLLAGFRLNIRKWRGYDLQKTE